MTNFSIGWALAFIANDCPIKQSDGLILKDEDKKKFNTIKDRFFDLKNKPDEMDKIISTVPQKCCPPGAPFLKNNTDFFIAFIILSENNKNDIKSTPQLIKHLNDCYWCFENYNNFIRDFYYTSQKLMGEYIND